MPADARYRHTQRVHRRHHRAGRGDEVAKLDPRHGVQGVDLGDVKTLHHALIAHVLGSAEILFRRLEDQRHPPAKVAGLSQIACSPKQHGGVSVMTAGMHQPLILRRVVQPGQFLHRQSVHISPQPDGRPIPLPVDNRHNARDTDLWVDLIHTKLTQAVADKRRCLVTLQPKLGVLVQMTAPALHIFVKISDTVDNSHGALLNWVEGFLNTGQMQ